MATVSSSKVSQNTIGSQPHAWSFLDHVAALPLSFAIICLLSVCTLIYNKKSTGFYCSSARSNNVPFIVFQEPDWTLLHKCAEQYRTHNLRLLQTLSQGLDILLHNKELTNLDRIMGRVENRIDRLSKIFDHDQDILERQLFVPFDTTYVLPDGEPTISTNAFLSRAVDHSYDDPHQVVAHIVRDWTAEGKQIRRQLYDWCLSKIKKTGLRIMVPGAGMGRLAWELARNKHAWVEALESSVGMAAAAASILQRKQSGMIHPYSSDQLSNEVNSSHRYLRVQYPDVDDMEIYEGHLSYTVADFLLLNSVVNNQSKFDVVVTCFFLDTATNVMEYIATIIKLLKPKEGMWVNVGPLQWHQKSQIRLSADELYNLIEEVGFKIMEWGVDVAPIEYRSSHKLVRSTHYDAYCPLRFVAVLD
jgi:carnosine N-methyltransferase